jgi:hypothetical protein
MSNTPPPDHHQRKMVDALRALDPAEHKVIKKWVDGVSDDDIIRHMFRNARIDGDNVRGGRLSQNGAKLLKTIYTFWEIKLDRPLTMRQQLRFARACRLPYYYSDRVLVSFEKDVGVWLAMIKGNMALMDNVLPEY